MNYVESLKIGGVPAFQIPCIKRKGEPTTETEGDVGCFYMDTDTGKVYKCTAAANGVYTWEVFGGGVSADVKTSESQEAALLGEELSATSGTWTAEGWTGSLENGFTHTSGNTTPLVFTPNEATGTKLYQISFYSSVAMTTNNLMVRVGGSELFNLYGQADPISVGIRSAGDGVIEFIPESGFTGTLTEISIREILATYDGNYKITDSRGNESFIVRTTKVSTAPDCTNGESNIFVGPHSGEWNTSGYGNVAMGAGAMNANTSGFWNVGVGFRALESNTAGSRNLAMGYVALLKNEVGQRNVALGTHALREHRKGDFNIAIGADSQLEGTEGEGNVGIGVGTLYKNSGGNYNIAIGHGAIGGGELGSRGDDNIGIGRYAMPSVTGHGNICIGKQAGYGITTGVNNVVIGANSGRSGTSNTILGAICGQYLNQWAAGNVLIGYGVGSSMSGGSYNILIGREIAGESGSEYTRNLNIGNLLKGKLDGDTDPHLDVNGGLQLSKIPTSDPGIAGRVWNDNGTLKVSAG